MKTIKYLIAAAAGVVGLTAASARAQEVVVAGAGGVLAQVTKDVFETPFTAKTGIKVRAVAADNYLARMKAMQQTGNIEWDLTEATPETYPVMVKNGWLEPLDWSKLDPKNEQPASARATHGVASAVYSTVLAFRTDKLPAGKTMASWADFWDVKTFPGPRSLQDTPVRNLEFALLADGVPPGDLYKVLATADGVDRAFRKLDAIKPHVTTWWKGAAQPIQLLASGEVNYATTFNGRVSALQADKVPVEMMWNGGSLNVQYVVIPKGAKNVANAYEYLKATYLDPERDAEFTKKIKYPNLDPRTLKHLPEDLGRAMPTHPDNVKAQFTFDGGFWSERLEAMQERWAKWLLQ
ncbi:MAG TPA: ABC transporter substrate-binding protein [Microvirga sp.]|jgi:putative spermidine/putrescine transport system substrate-binding protein